MDQLIPVINELHDTLSHANLSTKIELPQIVVVGAQSSGKSSVLETIVGRDFLPRGTGIVTRRPLVLQLYQTEEGEPEYAEFSHKPGKRFTDFLAVRKEIQDETNSVAGGNAGISTSPINLKIFSPHVLTLTLVDLPGLVKIPIGDQPKNIEKHVREMVLDFITPKKSIILAVTPANSDVATSDAIQMAQNVDPEGERTLGVLTKLDLMDKGTDAMDVLEGKVVPFKRGFIGVVNRSQADINASKTIEASREAEQKWFASHPIYSRIATRLGTPFLAKTLSGMLLTHIKECLPELRARIDELLKHARQLQAKYGVEETAENKGAMLLQLLNLYSVHVCSLLDGTAEGEGVLKNELWGGARIQFIFHSAFAQHIQRMTARSDLTDDFISTTLLNSQGLRTTIFPSDVAFEILARSQIQRLEDPSLRCISFVHDEVVRVLESAAGKLDRYPTLKQRVKEYTGELAKQYRRPTEDHVRNIFLAEAAYINTNHPDLLDTVAQLQEGAVAGLMPASQTLQQPQHAHSDPNDDTHSTTSSRPPRSHASGAPTTATTGAPSMQPTAQQPIAPSRTAPVRSNSPSLSVQLKDNRFEDIPMEIKVGDSFTPHERRQHETMRCTIEAYFTITKKTVVDQIPKLCVLFQVNRLKKDLYNSLVSKFYKEDLLDELLTESEIIAHHRKAAAEMIRCLSRAQETLMKVRDLRPTA